VGYGVGAGDEIAATFLLQSDPYNFVFCCTVLQRKGNIISPVANHHILEVYTKEYKESLQYISADVNARVFKCRIIHRMQWPTTVLVFPPFPTLLWLIKKRAAPYPYALATSDILYTLVRYSPCISSMVYTMVLKYPYLLVNPESPALIQQAAFFVYKKI
jgi:hypothetical protein